ncbi:MAG: hypothetical protein J6L64_02105 [Opitutales bacterium]|nr:hypothetical protein [Opitutales bacterium]
MASPISSFVNPLWPDAFWDVSGAFVNDRELLLFHDFFLQTTGIKILKLVHGSPLFLWNSGRVLPRAACTAEQMRDAGLAYARRGIAVDLTFTNHLLKEEHVSDPTGNALLNFFERQNPTGNNAVICASDALFEHVGKNYPKLKRVSSILKVTVENGRGNADYYRKLAERFDKVMVHPDDSTNFEMLAQLEDKDRYEILVNEYCIRGCKIRPWHYKYLSSLAMNYFGHVDQKFDERWKNNGCSDLNVLVGDPERNCAALTQDEIKRLYDLGFRKFKVQGRGMLNGAGVLYDLLRLALREDAPGENYIQRLKLQFLEATSTLTPAV